MTGTDLPHVVRPVPAARSRALVDILARHEGPAVTARRARRASELGASDDDPIVWDAAVGSNVSDVDGNVYVDLCSGFGVALLGHRDPEVMAAAKAQIDHLPHAMGDAFPDRRRIALLEALAATAPPGLEVALLGLSGSDAVDAAVRTALLATGRPGVLTLSGGYHGLALGVAPLQSAAPRLTAPFTAFGRVAVRHLPAEATRDEVDEALRQGAAGPDGRSVPIGLVLAEPVIGRGGTRPLRPGLWSDLASAARAHGAVFAADEILTGLGRTGMRWASTREGVVPDLLLTGKALGGGFPISAALGGRALMDAWGPSAGEALLTQTFLGHPVACAAAEVVLARVRAGLPDQVAERGVALRTALERADLPVRGEGLLLAASVQRPPLRVARDLLQRGWIALPAGADAIGLWPPVTLSDRQIDALVHDLAETR